MSRQVIFVLTLIKLTLLLAASEKVLEERITGGHEAIPHSHPYLVSLQIRFIWVRQHICGAALLNERWVLTAAHCIKESWLVRWLPMDAVAGAHDVDKFGPEAQVIGIQERISHPLYKGGITPNDIAVVKTKMPFIFTKVIQPVTLPSNINIKYESLALTGWGALRTTLFIPDLPSKLQEVNVSYIPYKECYDALEAIKEPNEKNPLDADANICSGPISGGVAACNGDSGGPLVEFIPKSEHLSKPIEKNRDKNTNGDKTVQDENNKNIFKFTEQNAKYPIIIGVVSWGVSPCGEIGAPTVYTKVSHYMDFISKHINKI